MERLAPNVLVILRTRMGILQRKYDALLVENERQKKLANHWRARHHEVEKSRDKWCAKAKARRRKIQGLEHRLAALDPSHPFHAKLWRGKLTTAA